MPTWIRSSISTLAGSLAIIWWARRRTSPLYCFSVVFRSSWPLAVYMAAPEIMRTRGRRRPWVARSGAPAGPSASAPSAMRRTSRRSARRGRLGGVAGRVDRAAQSRSTAPKKSSAQVAIWIAMRSARGELRRGAQHQVVTPAGRRAASAASSPRRRG